MKEKNEIRLSVWTTVHPGIYLTCCHICSEKITYDSVVCILSTFMSDIDNYHKEIPTVSVLSGA